MSLADDFWDEDASELPREERRHLMTDKEWRATCTGDKDHPDNKDPFECYQCSSCHQVRTNRSAHIKRDGVWEVIYPTHPSVCAGPEDQPHPEVLVQAQQPCPVCLRNGYRPPESWEK